MTAPGGTSSLPSLDAVPAAPAARAASSVGRTWTVVLTGLAGHIIEVEADLSTQTPGFAIIGLPDKAIGEAQQRVHNACGNSDLPLPRRRVVVNLSPASLPKRGTGLDVAVAIAALATELPLRASSMSTTVHLGELGLDGRLRPIPGILPAVLAAAAAGFERVIVPASCADEAGLVQGMEVIGAVNLRDVARYHGLDVETADQDAVPVADRPQGPPEPLPDLAEVVGQRAAVDALIVAAAGVITCS